jgi:hypothetical protein
MDEDELTEQELEDERGDLLPEREAMSLISTNLASAYPLPDGDMPEIVDETGGGTPTAGTGYPAAGMSDQARGIADAAGSGTSSESATPDDRSEQFTASDSATAQS